MATEAVAGYGTLLKIGDGAGPEVFTTIAEVKDISGPSIDQGTEEVTTHSSPGRAREFIATLLDGGEVSFDVNWTADATQGPDSGLYDDMIDGTRRNFQLAFPTETNDVCTFPGIVTGYEFDAPVEGVLGASITIKVTGLPVWS